MQPVRTPAASWQRSTFGMVTRVSFVPPDVDGYLARWNALVAQQNFSNGLVSLVITPTDPRVVATPTLINAPIYRVRVVVEWNEEARRRSIVLDTTKIDRTK